MSLCPDNKRTRKALWSLVQANVDPKTVLHTADGLGKPLGTISAVQTDFCREGGGGRGLKTLAK